MENTNYLNRPFIRSELKAALRKKKSTAPGSDHIHYTILKKLPPESKIQLLNLINKSWSDGVLPDSWKEVTIIPILKPYKDKSNAASYRPISLTSAICKVMETMVANILKYHLEENHLLAPTQSGFRNNRSTLDQLTRLESVINSAFATNQTVTAVFLDLEKAFDLMWTKGTIKQLASKGINNIMLLWINNFLSNRIIRVRIGTTHAEYHTVENGSPQGSVISPILFNVIIDTLYDKLKNGPVGLSQFADDSAIWKVNRNIEKTISDVQRGLDIISEWQNTWGFKISPIKTEAVIFSRTGLKYDSDTGQYIYIPGCCPKNNTGPVESLMIGGRPIPFKKQAKFLGMTLDQKLSWIPHINDLTNRCRKDLNLLKLISGTSYGADKKSLLLLYKSLILSKLDYGSTLYQSASPTQLKRLDVIQNAGMRIATGAYISTNSRALGVECVITPLPLRREENMLKYWARIKPHGSQLPVNDLIQPTYAHTMMTIKNDKLAKKHLT